ncbi:MAG: hypothetical protein JW984_07945 [Deltaproteobacteria bacterium]|uniref:Uncharacterized protein n=1 Tax=Candidatus Zymogenus saltonus TaxID=2844893 RepID=A0A9D8KDR5_9DELT|nr:hypothetical protein [Candidatus Zymogenus saltonus]
MRRKLLLMVFMVVLVLSAGGTVIGQPLDCYNYGESIQYGSGWCDLKPPINLAEETCLKLTIGGTATKVLVRLLKGGEDPNSAVGLIGDPITVPSNRIIIVKLKKAYLNVVQVSVHGNPSPFGIDLGINNGPARLDMVEKVDCPAEK